jgi:hypothetical protein
MVVQNYIIPTRLSKRPYQLPVVTGESTKIKYQETGFNGFGVIPLLLKSPGSFNLVLDFSRRSTKNQISKYRIPWVCTQPVFYKDLPGSCNLVFEFLRRSTKIQTSKYKQRKQRKLPNNPLFAITYNFLLSLGFCFYEILI